MGTRGKVFVFAPVDEAGETHRRLEGQGCDLILGKASWDTPQGNSEGNAVVPVDANVCALDMGSPDAQEYIVSIVRELVTNYPIDGINWDDEINGTGYSNGMGFPAYSTATYPRSGLGRYRSNTGYIGTPSATDATYGNYRRRFKNELIARCLASSSKMRKRGSGEASRSSHPTRVRTRRSW